MSATSPTARPRIAGPDDLGIVTTIIERSFAEDPVWGPAYARAASPSVRTSIWRSYLTPYLRFPCTWLSPGYESASAWIPPDEDEMTDEQWSGFSALLQTSLGPDAEPVLALFERFEASHPRHEPHYYLSLLGTHPDHRGAGHGMRLLADNLAQIDAETMPAYLESTNPGNDARYGRLGFEAIGSFEGFVPGSRITTMWRPARG